MAWYHKLFNINDSIDKNIDDSIDKNIDDSIDKNIDDSINEDIDAFKKLEEKPKEGISGEGFPANVPIEGFGNVGLSSFNIFYKNYINKGYKSEIDRLKEYRRMAETSEISDIIEDATNEATQLGTDNKVINFVLTDKKLSENDNISKNIYDEFSLLFEERIDFRNILWDLFHTYMIDGKVFYERVIDEKNPKKGILNIKRLPTETMDFVSDPKTGKILYFFQYLKDNQQKPSSYEEAKKLHETGQLILFNPGQIGYIDYGVYGNSIHEVRGYLEKARIPFNQLKLLETSVVIYRIVRAPERLVFRIDTGNMPRDKALKYVEKIKQKMTKKQTYNPSNGTLTNDPDIMCIRKNTEIPLLDGRYLTLEQIIDEHNNGKENWVYTINQKTLNIEPGKIKHAKITRRNENLIRVWFDDDGNYIDTTYDHKFILRDGSECRADELEINQSLMPLYKKQEVVNKNRENQLYEYVYNPGGNIWNPTHKIVSEKVVDRLGFKDYSDYRLNFAKILNHKVSKIEYLSETDDTGCIEVEGNHNFAVSRKSQPLVFIRNSMLENFYLPQSADGRGSQVESVGGSSQGFSELEDIYYFSRKLYRALKYPLSRVTAGQEKREADIVFGGSQTSEISRDEIKWAKFLERQQSKFAGSFSDMFLIHLQLRGFKSQYNLNRNSFSIYLNRPSHYKEQMDQMFLESRFNNYQVMADREEFSKYYLMKKYLNWSDEEINDNAKCKDLDKKKLGISDDDISSY